MNFKVTITRNNNFQSYVHSWFDRIIIYIYILTLYFD